MLPLPILTFTSASDPPCLSTMLPRYVKFTTSSGSSPSSVIGLVLAVLHFRILCMLRPDSEEVAILAVYTHIRWYVWDRRDRSSAKFKSPSCIQAVHCILYFHYVEVFIIQPVTRREKTITSSLV
ncbi:unnamed protein product [Schistosoma margrebowiei]|uniref:Uncharacterized protein n=1 Tax=Schistosoma margrebowiei TaxID=48269 RepID=A0AA84ZEH2_9TREM|nr:unnamed protein product [Schistosoma margrebowiei]